jgi:hypothetical protein
MRDDLNSLESPHEAGDDEAQEQESSHCSYRSPRLLGALVCTGLITNVAAAVAALYLQLKLHGLTGASIGEEIDTPNGRADDLFWSGGADIALQLLRVLTGVVFLAWMYRVHCNLLALGHRKLDWRPIAGLVVWFIPLVGLVLPCLVMREITWRSSPHAEQVGRGDRSLVLVNWWWGLFLFAPISFCVQLLFPDVLESFPSDVAFRWNVTLYLSVVASGILACWLVLHINAQQGRRYRLLQSQPSEPALDKAEPD